MDRKIIVRIEPSSRLSELCGFPYFVERRFSVEEVTKQVIINADDISEMLRGKEICKKIPIVKDYLVW